MSRPKRTKTPPKTAALSTKLAAVTATATKISAADRERAESLLAEIARRIQRIGEDFYDIGLALRELLKRRLHLPLGYSSFGAMLKARGLLSESQAHKLIKLVESVPRAQAMEYGQEKAAALITYAKATPEVDTPRLLMEGGKLPSGKAVAEASVREVKEASRIVRTRARAGAAKAKSPAEREAAREARATQAWAREMGAKKAVTSAVKREGELWLRLELPVSQAVKLRG